MVVDEVVKEFRLVGVNRADNQVRAGYPSCHPAGMPAADVCTRLP
jgi:hypothetical protein